MCSIGQDPFHQCLHHHVHRCIRRCFRWCLRRCIRGCVDASDVTLKSSTPAGLSTHHTVPQIPGVPLGCLQDRPVPQIQFSNSIGEVKCQIRKPCQKVMLTLLQSIAWARLFLILLVSYIHSFTSWSVDNAERQSIARM